MEHRKPLFLNGGKKRPVLHIWVYKPSLAEYNHPKSLQPREKLNRIKTNVKRPAVIFFLYVWIYLFLQSNVWHLLPHSDRVQHVHEARSSDPHTDKNVGFPESRAAAILLSDKGFDELEMAYIPV